MQKHLLRLGQTGAFFTAGLLVQNKFHGLSLGMGDWLVLTWAALAVCLVLWALTESELRERRPTLRIGRRDGLRGVWVQPPFKPIFVGRRERKRASAREVEVARRAIGVGDEVLAAYRDASAAIDPVNWDLATYQAELQALRTKVGAQWQEVLADLRAIGVDTGRAEVISVNFTGLDVEATQVQALGRQLLRKHGINPDRVGR